MSGCRCGLLNAFRSERELHILVDLNIGSFPGTREATKVTMDMDDKPRQWLEHLLQGRHISGEVRESVFEKALGIVESGVGTLAGLKAQGWDVLQSTENANSTRHHEDDGREERQGGGTDKG